MELKEYIKQSERTMIDKGFSMNMLHVAWGLFTEVGELVDQAKKYIFYNKPLDLVNMKEELGDVMWYLAIIAREFKNEKQTILEDAVWDWADGYNYMSTDDSKQNLIDKLDELQTQLEYLRKECMALYRSQSTGYLEENLNTFIEAFFNLIISLGLSFHDILETNINKLLKRYPEKFDSNLALNRDLKAEREVLEGLNTKTEQVDYIDLHLQSGLREYRQNLGLTIDQLADLLKVTPVDIKHYENLRVPMTVKQAQKLIKWDQQQREKEKNKSLLYYANAHIEPSITIEDFHTKTEQVDYISELHDKGLYVDNSGIDSRVPKVVNDGV